MLCGAATRARSFDSLLARLGARDAPSIAVHLVYMYLYYHFFFLAAFLLAEPSTATGSTSNTDLQLLPREAPPRQPRFVICPTCNGDAGVWYYEAAQRLYYVDINWPKPWGGKCPAQNVSDIKPFLQRVDPAALAGMPGRLVGSNCEPPCQHFDCSLLSSSHWSPPPPPPPLPVDEWAKLYRNWTYYPTWAIPPSCLDPATCPNVRSNFTDIAQAWRVPGDETWRMTYTFFDGVGYQTAMALSKDLLHWDQSPGTVYSPRENRPPLSWNATRECD